MSSTDAQQDVQIGDEMPDGTIYAGISPDTNQPGYATPWDASRAYVFNKAVQYASSLNAHGHHDFRVPSKDELDVLWQNRNKGKLAGTFNETGADPAGYYWSSSPDGYGDLWAQRFSDGTQGSHGRWVEGTALRCVRG